MSMQNMKKNILQITQTKNQKLKGVPTNPALPLGFFIWRPTHSYDDVECCPGLILRWCQVSTSYDYETLWCKQLPN